MSLPFSTTTIRVRRDPQGATAGARAVDGMVDPYDEEERPPDTAAAPNPTIIASGVPAVIGKGRGRADRTMDSGTASRTVFRLDADPCDLVVDDWVDDELTGESYRVDWVHHRTMPDTYEASHVEAGILAARGSVAPAP